MIIGPENSLRILILFKAQLSHFFFFQALLLISRDEQVPPLLFSQYPTLFCVLHSADNIDIWY